MTFVLVALLLLFVLLIGSAVLLSHTGKRSRRKAKTKPKKKASSLWPCKERGREGRRGLQGKKGNQGVQGPSGGNQGQGNQGTQGYQGAQGLGVQGPSGGNQGNQGYQGAQGLVGFGLQGVQGNQGNDGIQGNQGNQGAQGSGVQGPSGGAQGVQGPQGMGSQGPQGDMGSQGVMGLQGPQGAQGSQGNQGLQGAFGAQGFQGFIGEQGAPGGFQGFQGPTSPGNQGNQGAQGVQGAFGASGLQGAQGPQGNQGVQGPVGEGGTQGPQGAQGNQGNQGNQGVQGFGGTGEPPLTATEKVWVNKGGNDVTGDGTLENPFLTIQRAMNAIVDASAVKMYNINVGAGIYDDPFNQKPFVFVIAEARRQTVISALATIGLDPTFATAGTVGGVARAGLVDLTLNAPTNYDLTTVGGTGNARFEIWHSGINQPLNFRARRDGDGISIESSFINAGMTGAGSGNSVIINCYVGSDVFITTDPNTGATFWELANVYFNFGNLSLRSPAPPNSLFLRVNLMNVASWISTLTVGGALTTVYSNGLPLRTQVFFVDGAISDPSFFIRTSDAFSWGYSPVTPADWTAPPPFNIQQALDRLAARVALLGPPLP